LNSEYSKFFRFCGTHNIDEKSRTDPFHQYVFHNTRTNGNQIVQLRKEEILACMPIKQQPTHERGDRKVFHIYFMLSLLIIILNKIINKDKNDNKKKKIPFPPLCFQCGRT
jgi:hypothetical protein